MISVTEDLVVVARSDVVNFSEELCFCVDTLLSVSQASSARMSSVRFLMKALVNRLPISSPDSKLLHTLRLPLNPPLILLGYTCALKKALDGLCFSATEKIINRMTNPAIQMKTYLPPSLIKFT